jgi:hypothetical protein
MSIKRRLERLEESKTGLSPLQRHQDAIERRRAIDPELAHQETRALAYGLLEDTSPLWQGEPIRSQEEADAIIAEAEAILGPRPVLPDMTPEELARELGLIDGGGSIHPDRRPE